MSIYQYVRDNVTARQAAEFYGLEVRNKMCRCPFHDDRHPSMIVGDYFKCFSCHAGGDATEFVRRYFNISPKEAADKIISDFGLADINNIKEYIPQKPAVSTKLSQRRWILDAADTLFEYRDLLRKQRDQYRPVDRDEDFQSEFVEAVRKLEEVEYLLEMATSTDPDERVAFYNSFQHEIKDIRQRLEAEKDAAFSDAQEGVTYESKRNQADIGQ